MGAILVGCWLVGPCVFAQPLVWLVQAGGRAEAVACGVGDGENGKQTSLQLEAAAASTLKTDCC